MRGAVPALLLCLPSIACAENTTGQEFSFFSSFLQMIAALAVVIGLILITWHFFNRFTRGIAAGRFAAKHIRVVESRYIAPKKSLILVEVGGEYLLLSCTDDRLTLIKQIDMLEEIEILPEGTGSATGFAGILDRLRS
ncbi:flagellar biosynthetic protein FliO [Geobacter sp. AOG2]|uniref:flagellar biosynthetic protein FliO n=1 Tax=Geobacter sp. AOG2 TaxID=1566347 RepID=UPI001CC7BBCD|nr:flagellar biosynthetic protein FliO [Geobacter sp. AOG2]GFE59493.1 flagellar protein [Geobacter sp. AOG2]